MKKLLTLYIVIALAMTAGATANPYLVNVKLDVSDSGSGLGLGASMRFSNDSRKWTKREPFERVKRNWDVRPNAPAAPHYTVYAEVCDSAQQCAIFSSCMCHCNER